MKEIIELYRNVVIQIATPYSTGTGFFLKEHKLVVTNWHVVRDNRRVVIGGSSFDKQIVEVKYIDPKYDLAFLAMPSEHKMPEVNLGVDDEVVEGEEVIAIGHPFGLKYTATQGIVSNTRHQQNDIQYIQHDAALNPGNSGGPLVNHEGRVIGVNTFIIRDGNNIGFSLPINYLKDTIAEFSEKGDKIGLRCHSCSNLVFEDLSDKGYCPFCGTKIELPSEVEEYEPVGVVKTVEEILEKTGHHVELSRLGPNNWEIHQGSARINIAYYEKNGLITADAYLGVLPKQKIKPIYEFLLRQNYEVESLNFSVRGKDMILSLLIYDRYLNAETGMQLFNHLFNKADFYDNVLVEKFGANWKYDDLQEQKT